MAQTGFTPISIYYSSTASNVPTAGNLVAGELAINTADGRLFYKDSSNVVQVIGTKGGVGTSSTTQVLYNSSGLVVGSANLTFNGTTLTTANDASISGLTVGKGGGADTYSTAVGVSAIGNSNSGSNNNAYGYQALTANTSGGTNSAFGRLSLGANTTGSSNIAYGHASMQTNTTGSSNTAIGQEALKANTTASNNTAVGYQAGYSNQTGPSLTLFGYQAGYSNTSNGNITAIGYQAGYSCTAGASTFLGYTAGSTFTGSYGIFIGNNSQPASVGDNNEIVIGCNGITGKGSSTGFISPNGGGVYQGNNSTLWSITSDQRLKKNIVDNTDGLNKITAIQVRNFEYRTADEVTELEPQNAIDIKGVQLGAIAQELQAILPECVKQESTGIYTVDADPLIWYLVNAVKELNAKITALENK